MRKNPITAAAASSAAAGAPSSLRTHLVSPPSFRMHLYTFRAPEASSFGMNTTPTNRAASLRCSSAESREAGGWGTPGRPTTLRRETVTAQENKKERANRSARGHAGGAGNALFEAAARGKRCKERKRG